MIKHALTLLILLLLALRTTPCAGTHDPEKVFFNPPESAKPGVLWMWMGCRGNRLEIEVTNVWPNRLIGDEQEPPDCEWSPGHMGHGRFLKQFPDWFVKGQPRPSKVRYCFTTWNCFTKDSPLVPSGVLGPVTIQTTERLATP